MRLSSLVVAVILLFSSAVFAQHSSSSSAPSSPAPSPAPSAAPSSPPPTPAPSPSPSAASSASASHSGAPSSPGPVSVPESHAAPIPSSSGGHASGPSSSDWSAARTASPARSSDPSAGRVISGEKLPGNEGRIVASPRIGEAPLVKEKEKEKDSKTPESDLRRRICPNGLCKEPEPKPAEADLRRRVCKDGPCAECPPGGSKGKNGTCVATAAPADTASTLCPPNESWNGSSCIATAQCRPGESWNGVECVNPSQCATFGARADLLTAEARGISADMQAACLKDPQGQECISLTQSHDGAVQRYRMLLNEAPVSCRTMLPDPLSL
jgi:hypothetical protein